jgi:cyclopropane-fatty-acyl-phospholipid synthase
VVSIGMFEHVGPANYATFFRCVHRCLASDGLFLLHTIGGPRSVQATDRWIGTYIFPDSLLPSAAQITQAAEGLFVLEDWHNFGADYDRTLVAWARNFERAWPALRNRFDERFRRMWRYYLLTSAGTFRARRTQLWQIVFSKRGLEGGYRRCGT